MTGSGIPRRGDPDRTLWDTLAEELDFLEPIEIVREMRESLLEFGSYETNRTPWRLQGDGVVVGVPDFEEVPAVHVSLSVLQTVVEADTRRRNPPT